MLLLTILLTCILELSVPASGYLEDCPIDRKQRIGNDWVVGVLGQFHQDLRFVGAVTELKQLRDYRRVVQGARKQLRDVAVLLASKNYQEAIERCDRLDREWNGAQENESDKTYLHYFRAEAYRLMGDVHQASEHITEATRRRETAVGVSFNDLERLDGLITLQRVLKFNYDIDKMFGLLKGPNTNLLKSSYWLSQVSTDPMSRQDQSAGYTRIRSDLDDLSGRSASEGVTKSILCEFAQKLAIVESSFNSGKKIRTDYASVLEEIGEVDPKFASLLEQNVDNPQYAWIVAEKIIDSDWTTTLRMKLKEPSTSGSHFEYRKEQLNTWQTYAKYLEAGAFIGHDDWQSLSRTDKLLSEIKNIRREHNGVSLGKLATMEGHVVFKSMKSFHEKIRHIYRLSGREDAKELEAKRTYFGTGDRVIPHFNY